MNPKLLKTSSELDQCVSQLMESPCVGLDLEFDKNRFRYGFNLCLMQISTKENVFLIDPFEKEMDVSKLFPVFENESIEKVVYSFHEDMRLLHSLGCFPKNIFDLNFAVRFLNFSKTSLANALVEIMGIEVGSSAQKSNWFIRPLTNKQIRYASEDVYFLIDLKEKVHELTKNKGVHKWVEEENIKMTEKSHEETSDKTIFREKYKNGLNEVEWHILKSWLNKREEVASKANRPSFQMVNPEVFLDLIKEPNLLNSWSNLKGIHPSLKNNGFKDELLHLFESKGEEAVAIGLSYDKPARPRLSKEEYMRFKSEKARQDQIRNDEFKPIQELIIRDYGEFAMPNILGKRVINDIIQGNSDGIRNYQKEVVLKYNSELAGNVHRFFS